jgi:cytochrome c
VILWDLETGNLLSRVDTGEDKTLSLAVSPSGDRIATASWDRTVRLYSMEDDRLQQRALLEGHRGNVNAVVFSHDGKTIFSAASDGVIRAFGADEGRLLREVHSHGWGVNVLLRTGMDTQLVFGAVDGTLAVLDTISGEVEATLSGHSRPVLALARSGDGRFFASGGGDGRIQVFDARTRERIEEYETPFGPVWGLSLNIDASVALHAGLDDFVKVWQVSPRRPFEPADGVYPRRFQANAELEPGERQFARKCSVCHTLTPDDGNRAGPTLYGVFGRRAGTLPGYPYSRALVQSDLVWNEKTISDLFDHGPDVVTPGSKMPIQHLKSTAERNALVAFLKRATDPNNQSAPSLERMPTR